MFRIFYQRRITRPCKSCDTPDTAVEKRTITQSRPNNADFMFRSKSCGILELYVNITPRVAQELMRYEKLPTSVTQYEINSYNIN